MNTISLFHLSFLLTAGLAILPLSICGALENGGFESWQNGLPAAWQTGDKTGVTEERQGMHGGQACVCFDLSATRNSAELLPAAKMPADPAKVYRLTFFFRQEPGCTSLFDLRCVDAAGKTWDVPLLHWREPAPDWTEKIIKLVPPATAREMVLRIYAVGNGKVWVDDVVFTEDGPKNPSPLNKQELLFNPGFEDYGDEEVFGNRVVSGQWRPNAPVKVSIVRNPQKAHAGKNCLYLEQESEGQGAIYMSGIPVDYLKRYRIRFWAKGDGDLTNMVYQFPWPTVTIGSKIELTPDWKEYEMEYQPSSSLVNRVGFAFHFIGELWLDDTSFQEKE